MTTTVTFLDGPAAGRTVEVGPLRRMVTVSLGTRHTTRRYGDVTVDVEQHLGLATYLRDDETGEWRHVTTPLAIGDGIDVATGRRSVLANPASERGEEA